MLFQVRLLYYLFSMAKIILKHYLHPVEREIQNQAVTDNKNIVKIAKERETVK